MAHVRTLCTCLFLAAVTVSGWGQANHRTAASKPVTTAVENPEAAINAATTFASTFTFNITVNIKSALPSSDAIACTATASVDDQSPTTFAIGAAYEEEASVQASRGTSSATCSVKIPYSWALNFGSTDTVSLSVSVTAPGFFVSTTNALPNRFHTHILPSMKGVPSGGATFTLTETI